MTQAQLAEALESIRQEFGQRLDAALRAQRLGGAPAEGPPEAAPSACLLGADREPAAAKGDAGSGGFVTLDLAVAAGQQGGAEPEPSPPKTILADEASDSWAESYYDGVLDASYLEDEVALTGSFWDAAVFIGCPHVGACGSVFTAVALLLNIGMQVVFCLIVNDSLTPAKIDDSTVQDFRDWRTTVAHNVRFVDDITFRSLARKVCTFQDAPLSSGPIAGLAAISEYSPSSEEKGYRTGPPLGYWMPYANVGELMCCMSLVLWWFTVLRELFSIISLGQALYSLPSGRATKMCDTSGRLEMVTVSLSRRALFCAVSFVRFLVCVSLAVCGTLYLASTISLGDLLLNALALEVVLSLDELSFDVLAPRSVRLLISSIAPLPKPRSRTWRGLDGRPIAATVIVVVALSSVYHCILRDQSKLLEEARHELCGGDLDFIATVDQTGLVVAYSPDEGYGDAMTTGEYQQSQYEYLAFRDLIDNGSDARVDLQSGSSTDAAYGFRGGRFTVEGRRFRDLAESSSALNPACADLDYPGSAVWPTLSEILASVEMADSASVAGFEGLAPFRSCADVAPRCGEETTFGIRARQYCPVTCGCSHPASPLALFTSEHGCPEVCTEKRWYAEALGEMTCSDWAPDSPRTLRGIDLLDAYVEGLQATAWPAAFIAPFIQTINSTLHQYGCAGAVWAMTSHDGWYYGNLCEETNLYGFRPIAAICPVSCACQETQALLCPTTC